MVSPHVFHPRADDRAARLLQMPKKETATLAQLREYEYSCWAYVGHYYISTGWGQDAGRVGTEEEARKYCQYVRECMQIMAVYQCEECAILDLNVRWYEDCRLLYQGREVWAKPNEWRFKIIMSQSFEDWMRQWDAVQGQPVSDGQAKKLVVAMQWREVAKRWGMEGEVVKEIILAELREKKIPLLMTEAEFNAWVESEYKRWYHKFNRNTGERLNYSA